MIDLTARLQSRESGRLPVPTRTQAAIQTDVKREERGANRPLILVVEDHVATQNVLASVLDIQGYGVVCVANGQEALEWLEQARQRQQAPALILLDLFMPVMNGADFLAGLRQHWPGTQPMPPVILSTVDQDNHDDLACTEVLAKPFHIRDLLAKFRLVLNMKQGE